MSNPPNPNPNPNPNPDDISTKEEDLTEEQSNWYHEKNPTDPTPVSWEETEVLIQAVEVECLNCSIKKVEPYDTPITKLKYIEDSIHRLCPVCRDPYQLNPIEVGFEQTKNRSAYSMEEWDKLLNERYDTLKQTVNDNLPQLWMGIELVLSVKALLHVKDNTLPLIIILLGAPSSLKTVAIQLLRNLLIAYYSDNFTAKSFVSHNSGLKEEKLRENDLLPKIKNKLFLAPEMAPLFAKKEEDLKELIGILTRIADGHGYWSNSGACGGRGYSGEHMFNMIGAGVDIPHTVFKLLGTFGPKLYFARLPKQIKTVDDYVLQLQQDTFDTKLKRVENALNDYFNTFEMCPQLEYDKERELTKLEWDRQRENKDIEVLTIIANLGILLAHLRAVVPTWETHGTQGTDYAYATAIIEEPDRAMEQLRNIARGHALSLGRNYITKEDLGLPIKVVLSTASIDRVNIFSLLIAHGGKITTSKIVKSLNTSPPTARKTMIELKAVGLVDYVEKINSNEEKEIELKDKFNWFLGEEFSNLRDKFEPADYREYLKKDKKQQQPPEDDNININVNITSDVLKENLPPPTEPTEEELDFNNPLISNQDLEIVGLQQECDPRVINSIWRSNSSDLWHCNNCKDRGDKWYMMKHKCKGTD